LCNYQHTCIYRFGSNAFYATLQQLERSFCKYRFPYMYVMCSSCCYSHCKCNCVPLFSSFVLITTRVYRACHFDHASFSCSYVLFILHIFSEWRKKSYTYYRSIICIIARVHQCTLAVWINRNACSKVLSLRRLYKLLFGQKIILS